MKLNICSMAKYTLSLFATDEVITPRLTLFAAVRSEHAVFVYTRYRSKLFLFLDTHICTM